jgi:hypothetical protein
MRKVMSARAKPEDGSLRGLAVGTPIAVPNYLAGIRNDLRELRIGLDRGYTQEPVWFAVQGVAASDVLRGVPLVPGKQTIIIVRATAGRPFRASFSHCAVMSICLPTKLQSIT